MATNQTTEQLKENGRKGGIASGEKRRQKKALKETIQAVMSMPLYSGKKKMSSIESIKALEEVGNKNIEVQTAIILSIVKKAMKGDVIAATYLRDSMGENPTLIAEREEKERAKQDYMAYIEASKDNNSFNDAIIKALNERTIAGIDDEGKPTQESEGLDNEPNTD